MRHEAALRLIEGPPDDRARNQPILRNLLADRDDSIRRAAAVSLLILGETDVHKPILAGLRSPNRWEQSSMLDQLDRVQDGRLLAFARSAIAAAAENLRQDSYRYQKTQGLLQRIPPPAGKRSAPPER